MVKVITSFKGSLNPITSVDIRASANLELVDKFCYLGDMLSVCRGRCICSRGGKN